jgi:hypothetical protein
LDLVALKLVRQVALSVLGVDMSREIDRLWAALASGTAHLAVR